jgi:hypothetical protein
MPWNRAKKNRSKKSPPPIDPMQFFWTLLAWVTGLIPKLQTVIADGLSGAIPATVLPGKIYATVADHFIGTDAHESALWKLITGKRPNGVTQEQHEAYVELTSDNILMSADLAEELPSIAQQMKDGGHDEFWAIQQYKDAINDAIDEHDLLENFRRIKDAS